MNDLMVDIETFGTDTNAVIVQIGAVYFDRKSGKLGHEFKVNIDAQDAVKYDRLIDPSTVYWWLSQDKKAIDSILAKPLSTLEDALRGFRSFASHASCIWSHATFDFVLLNQSLKACGLAPLGYKLARDIRTLTDLAPVKSKQVRSGVHHDALDDAKFQVQYCMECLRTLKGDLNA